MFSLTAAIKKILAENVDRIVKTKMDSSEGRSMMALRSLNSVINDAAALGRKFYLYGSHAYGTPPKMGFGTFSSTAHELNQ